MMFFDIVVHISCTFIISFQADENIAEVDIKYSFEIVFGTNPLMEFASDVVYYHGRKMGRLGMISGDISSKIFNINNYFFAIFVIQYKKQFCILSFFVKARWVLVRGGKS